MLVMITSIYYCIIIAIMMMIMIIIIVMLSLPEQPNIYSVELCNIYMAI